MAVQTALLSAAVYGPVRLWFAFRSHADAGLLAAAVSVAVLFSATPFLIPTISEEFGVSLGTSGLLSTAQVGGFALTAFVAGRTLRTDRRYLVVGALTAATVNVLSVFVNAFWPLVLVRVIAGSSAGLLVWLAWANAMRTTHALRNVAATGPLSVLIAAPILSKLAAVGGADAVFLAIAAISLPPALLPAKLTGYRVERQRLSPSRSNVVLLIALAGMTMAGSSLFVFGAAIGEQQLEMSPFIVSLGYSLNAFAGLVAARRHASDRPGGWWVLGNAASAAAVAFGGHPIVFIAGLTTWGFCFWMATPSILRGIAVWSVVPQERVGDAQSAMALGRAAGPAVGALLVGHGTFGAVGAFSATGLLLCAGTVAWVNRYRRVASPPEGSVAASS